MALPEIDFQTLTDDELSLLGTYISQERNRRSVLVNSASQIDDLVKKVFEAMGGNGRAFVQPSGAHNSYPKDAIITFEGSTYKSKVANNVWSPAAYPAGWELQVEGTGEVPEPPEQPEATPWAAGQAVAVGDRRTYAGVTYVAVTAHTTQDGWFPPAVPAIWQAD